MERESEKESSTIKDERYGEPIYRTIYREEK